MNQLFKLAMILSIACANSFAGERNDLHGESHASRSALYKSMWNTAEGKDLATGICQTLMDSQNCDCKAHFCEITVLATHVRALGLIGIDYETGKQITAPEHVSLENKKQAYLMLLDVESSKEPRVLNAMAGLLREGANQPDGNATREDCKQAKVLYLSILKNNSENDEGFRAAACLGDMHCSGELGLKLFGLAAIYYAAAGKYGLEELRAMREKNEINQNLYERFVQ